MEENRDRKGKKRKRERKFEREMKGKRKIAIGAIVDDIVDYLSPSLAARSRKLGGQFPGLYLSWWSAISITTSITQS